MPRSLATLFPLLILVLSCSVTSELFAADQNTRPNIVWIVAEDASPHIAPYGETTIETPHLSRMAEEGVKFSRAFVTCPVCSPSRSAMVSGMYQTTLGAHNHRSQRASGKGGGNESYYQSYRVPESIDLVPTLFAEAGYYVVNGGTGKTDYNFTPKQDLYRGKQWSEREQDQPFFAQFQLRGGKNRGAKVANPVDPADVTLPPYYPDHPVLREDWARYLNSWINTDNEVGEILAELDDAGELENTVVFFWTDHGVSHARGKQFLYEEGVHVPLLVRFGDGTDAGTVRDDLVTQIDVAAASLELAGIERPEYLQGRPLFADDYRPARYMFSARDRCDETVDIIRCVRNKRYKYIRNFMSHVSHMQPNQYKDGKDIVQTLRELHAAGELNELQSRIFAKKRPAEELYDLEADPHETYNLLLGTADERRAHRDIANEMRLALYGWMGRSGDVGLIPEPILEELGKQAGNKYFVGQDAGHRRLVFKLTDVIDAAERGDVSSLAGDLDHTHPAARYWAATGLGRIGKRKHIEDLQPLLEDESAGVRVAAALAMGKLGETDDSQQVLVDALDDRNLVVGMYAIRGLEILGDASRESLPSIRDAQNSEYEFTRRIARRLTATLDAER